MPLAAPIAKPSPWAYSASSVASEWQPFAAKLVRAYPMWEGSGTTVADVKGGANGTLVGSFGWTTNSYGPAAYTAAGLNGEIALGVYDPPTRGCVILLLRPDDSGPRSRPFSMDQSFEIQLYQGRARNQLYNSAAGTFNGSFASAAYTLIGCTWDASTLTWNTYKDGALIISESLVGTDPGVNNISLAKRPGTNTDMGGHFDLCLILSEWPTQAEWDMLAADPFGWARQAEVSATGVELSGSSTLASSSVGALKAAHSLSGAAGVESSGSGALRAGHLLSGAATAGILGSGSVRAAHALMTETTEAAVTTTAAGSLGAGVRLSGACTTSVEGSAVLRAGHALSGTARAETGASGKLAVPTPLSGESALSLSAAGTLASDRSEVRYEYTTVTSLSGGASLATSYPAAPLAGISAVTLAGAGSLIKGVVLVGYGSFALKTDVALGTEYALSTRRKAA